LTPEIFDQAFTDVAVSDWTKRVFGAGLPDEVEPFSFITAAGLEEIAATLAECRGSTLVDLACGQGGPGLWLARRIGADLLGIDFSPVAIAQARERAERSGRGVRAEYRVADAASTGLPDASAAGLVCIDAIQLMAHQVDVMIEVARVLRPGAVAMFTTWEEPERLPDLAAVFEAGGLEVPAVEERPDWSDRERTIFGRAVADAPLYPDDLGLQGLAEEAQRALPMLDASKRVIGTARRAPLAA
jgi:SAM-dependent methyltransferase